MSLPAPHLRDSATGCELTVLARPRARRTAFAGTHDGALCVRVQAPPADGKANAELIRFLAVVFGVPKTAVRLRRGARSRRKTICIEGLDAAGASRLLSNLQTGE